MKVVVIGMGRQGRRRAEHLVKAPGIEEVWAYDTDQKQLENCPYPIADNPSNSYFDAAAICVPSSIHAEFAGAALLTGKHVLVEKPLTLDVETANELIELAFKVDKKIHVGLNMRYRSPVICAKGLMDQVGPVHRVSARIGHSQFLIDDGPRGLTSGGPLLDIGTHALDTCLYLLGWPKVELIEQNDYGAWGSCEVEVPDPQRPGLIRIEAYHDEWRVGVGALFDLHGTQGRLRIDLGDGAVNPRDQTELCVRNGSKVESTQYTFAFPDDCWTLDCQAFVRTVQGEIPSNAKQALRLVELLS